MTFRSSKFLAIILLCTTLAFGHTVTLTWTASATGATYYRVYRAIGSCATTFSLMGQVPGTQLNFVNGSNPDGSPLVEGDTYCYAVTTVLNGAESSRSNTTTAIIPIPPTNVFGVAN
jgi:hypothetical protein